MAAEYKHIIADRYEIYYNKPLVYEGKPVYQGYDRVENQKIVVKIVMDEKEALRELLPERMNHPNIIKILHHESEVTTRERLGRITKQFRWYIIMEQCDSNLAEYFRIAKPNDDEKLSLIYQITNGVHYLNTEKRVLHRDLKPGNILIQTNGKNLTVKIADYGHAKEILHDATDMTSQGVSTFSWRAPEQFLKVKDYSFPVDTFALGHIFLAMYVCEPKHKDKACQQLLVFTGRWPFLKKEHFCVFFLCEPYCNVLRCKMVSHWPFL